MSKTTVTITVLAFVPLSSFVVGERPSASGRKGKFTDTPASKWTHNEKVRRAAEKMSRGGKKYVEDGDTNYRVRFPA